MTEITIFGLQPEVALEIVEAAVAYISARDERNSLREDRAVSAMEYRNYCVGREEGYGERCWRCAPCEAHKALMRQYQKAAVDQAVAGRRLRAAVKASRP